MTATVCDAPAHKKSDCLGALFDFGWGVRLLGWKGGRRRRMPGGPLDDLKLSIEMLDSCGAAFHPVSAVHVDQAVDGADHRVVNMPANHTIDLLPASLRAQRLLEFADEIDGILDLELDPARQRPVGQAEQAPGAVEIGIERDREVVGVVAA